MILTAVDNSSIADTGTQGLSIGTKLWDDASKNSSDAGLIFADAPPDVSDIPGLHPWNQNINCKTVEDCSRATQMQYKAYAPICNDSKSGNCIADFWINLNGQTFHPIFESYAPKNPSYEFQGDLKRNLPDGKSPSIWKLSDSRFSKDPSYFAVSLVFRGLTAQGDIAFGYSQVNASIDQIEWQKIENNSDLIPSNLANICAAVEKNLCASRVVSKPDVRYGIKFRQGLISSSWIYGRLFKPEFSIAQKDYFPDEWSIEAEPIKTPAISGMISKDTSFEKLPDGYRTPWTTPRYISSEFGAVELFEQFRPFMGEKSTSIQSLWNFVVNRDDLYSRYQGCSSNGPIGVLSTNSTTFEGAPPNGLGTSDSFAFSMASPHLEPDGKEFTGFFELKMDTRFADCLYGRYNGAYKAELSIVDEFGIPKISVTSLNRSSKWLTFSASNFTFSKSTFKVKVLKNTSSKSTITCIKGKVTKKITAVSPKCPTGYKKK